MVCFRYFNDLRVICAGVLDFQIGCLDTNHNDIQHSDTQHKGNICDIQHNATQHKKALGAITLSVAFYILLC